MTDALKDFLIGSAPDSIEVNEFNNEISKLNKRLIGDNPEIQTEYDSVINGNPVEILTKEVNLSMPISFWRILDNFVESFDIRDRYGPQPNMSEVERIQANISKALGQGASNQQILLSQLLIDNLMQMTRYIARNEIAAQLNQALETGDEQTVRTILKGMGVNVDDNFPNSSKKD